MKAVGLDWIRLNALCAIFNASFRSFYFRQFGRAGRFTLGRISQISAFKDTILLLLLGRAVTVPHDSS